MALPAKFVSSFIHVIRHICIEKGIFALKMAILSEICLLFMTAARWAVVVIESTCLLDPLIALPTFSCSPTRATRDIVVEGDEIEEVKTS